MRHCCSFPRLTAGKKQRGVRAGEEEEGAAGMAPVGWEGGRVEEEELEVEVEGEGEEGTPAFEGDSENVAVVEVEGEHAGHFSQTILPLLVFHSLPPPARAADETAAPPQVHERLSN